MNLQSEVCIVCETKRKEGIYVYNNLICYECEKDMVNTETDDPKYIHYLKQLRKLEVSYF
ncbi:sigma factor G inhibitor Gin [Bacillus cereus]